MIAARPSPAFAFSHPAHAIALGFGAGLSPVAPGTAGTLVAWPIGWLMGGVLSPLAFIVTLGLLFIIGIWACTLTGRRLGVDDHGGMVWDEMVAFLLVVAIVPRDVRWQLAAFVLFRAFDVVKPQPIRWFEQRYHGGFGVMLDDILAAGYTLVVLAVAKRVLGW